MLAALLLRLLHCCWRCIAFCLLVLQIASTLLREDMHAKNAWCMKAPYTSGLPESITAPAHLALQPIVPAHVFLVLCALDLQESTELNC